MRINNLKDSAFNGVSTEATNWSTTNVGNINRVHVEDNSSETVTYNGVDVPLMADMFLGTLECKMTGDTTLQAPLMHIIFKPADDSNSGWTCFVPKGSNDDLVFSYKGQQQMRIVQQPYNPS